MLLWHYLIKEYVSVHL